MSPAITLFVGLTFSLTAAIVLYVAILMRIRRDEGRVPVAAIVPLATPVYAWRLGARGLAAGLAASMMFYGLMWISVALGAS